jgi:hypothetical protein
VLGESGRASPAPTGDEVACGVGGGGVAGVGRVPAVVSEAGSRRGPSLRSG